MTCMMFTLLYYLDFQPMPAVDQLTAPKIHSAQTDGYWYCRAGVELELYASPERCKGKNI